MENCSNLKQIFKIWRKFDEWVVLSVSWIKILKHFVLYGNVSYPQYPQSWVSWLVRPGTCLWLHPYQFPMTFLLLFIIFISIIYLLICLVLFPYKFWFLPVHWLIPIPGKIPLHFTNHSLQPGFFTWYFTPGY